MLKLIRNNVDGGNSIIAKFDSKPTVAEVSEVLQAYYDKGQADKLAEEINSDCEAYVGDMSNTHFELLAMDRERQ